MAMEIAISEVKTAVERAEDLKIAGQDKKRWVLSFIENNGIIEGSGLDKEGWSLIIDTLVYFWNLTGKHTKRKCFRGCTP